MLYGKVAYLFGLLGLSRSDLPSTCPKALMSLKSSGAVRFIGVSNYERPHLAELEALRALHGVRPSGPSVLW